MLEDFRLKVFLAVVENGSFTKAAESLGVSQPAVSQNVAELERITGRRLFDRMRGEAVLTSSGKVFKEYAQRIVGSYESLALAFAPTAAATVRVHFTGDMPAHMLLPVFESFRTVHQEINLEYVGPETADLVLHLAVASDSVFENSADSISRVRVSSGCPPKTGSYMTARENVMYFDLLYQPSADFVATDLNRVLKKFIIDSLSLQASAPETLRIPNGHI